MSDQFQVSERIIRFSFGLRGISALTGAGFSGVGNGRQWLFSGPNDPRENEQYPATAWLGISDESSRHNGIDYFRVSSVALGIFGNAIYGGGRFLSPRPARPSGWFWYGTGSVAVRIMGDNLVLVGLQRQSGIDQLYIVGYYRPFGQYAEDDNEPYDEDTNPTGWREFTFDEIDPEWSIVSAFVPGMWHPTEPRYTCLQQIKATTNSPENRYRAFEFVISEDEETTYHVAAAVAREWTLDAEHTVQVHNERVTPIDENMGPGFNEYNIYTTAPSGTGSLSWYDEGSRDESGVRGELIDVFYDSEGTIQGVILQSTYSLAYQYSRSIARDFVDTHWTGGTYASQFTRSAQSDMTLLVGDTLSIPWGSYTATYTPFTDDGTLCYGPDETGINDFSAAVFATQTITTAYRRKQLQFVDYRSGIILYMENRYDTVTTITVDGVRGGGTPPCAAASGGTTENRSIATEMHWGLYRGFEESVPTTKLAEDTFVYSPDFVSGAIIGTASMFSRFNLPNPGFGINNSGPYGSQPDTIDPVSVIPWEFDDLDVINTPGPLHPGGYLEDMFPWDPAWYADSDGRGNLLYSARLTSFLQSEEVATDPMIVDHTIAVFGDDLFDPLALLPDNVTLDDEQFLPKLTYIHAFSR